MIIEIFELMFELQVHIFRWCSMGHVEPIYVSLCYFGYVVLMCELGRQISRNFVKSYVKFSIVSTSSSNLFENPLY